MQKESVNSWLNFKDPRSSAAVKCFEIFHLNENLYINIQWVLLTRIDILIYPSGRHFGESGTVMFTWDLLQKVQIPISIRLSCCSGCWSEPTNLDVKLHRKPLMYTHWFFMPFTMLKRLLSPLDFLSGGWTWFHISFSVLSLLIGCFLFLV